MTPHHSSALFRAVVGVAVLAAGTVIASGCNTPDVAAAAPAPPSVMLALADTAALPVEGQFPGFAGATDWLNSAPLSAADLRGKVVLVDVWTYGCINCLRALPQVKAWAQKYKDQGLVVVGVHSPEFAYEGRIDNLKRAVGDLGVTFPVAVDNDFAIWRSLSNRFWPALYFVDAEGRIRHHRFGEGDYAKSEAVIRSLLDEAHGRGEVAVPVGSARKPGVELASRAAG